MKNVLAGIEHSIFRFSHMPPNDRDTYGNRSPVLLLKPGSYELLLAQGSTIDPNHNIQVSNKLNQGQDNIVKIASSED